MVSGTLLQPLTTMAAVNVMPYSAQKIMNLGITTSDANMNKPVNFASVATFAIRARMILDFRFGLAPAKKITNVAIWNSSIATLDTFGLKGIDKTKALSNITKADFEDIVRTVFGEKYLMYVNVSDKVTKEDALRVIDAIYEAGKAAKFEQLSWSTGNLSDLNTLINNAINGTDSTTSDTVVDNNPYLNISRESIDTLKITAKEGTKLDELTLVDSKGNKLTLDKDGMVKMKDPEATSITVKNAKGDTLATVRIPNYGKTGIELDKENYDLKIGTGTNIVAKLHVTGEETFSVATYGLYNDNSMGNIVVLDSSFDAKKTKRIRSNDLLTFTAKGNGTKTYYIAVENNSNTSDFNIEIYKGDKEDKANLIAKRAFDAYNSSNGEANIQLNQNLSTLSQDIGLGDTVKLAFNIQNMDTKPLTLKKFKLDGSGSADIKKAVLKDEKGNELSGYKVETSSRNDILVYLPDGEKGLNIDSNETRTIVIELQGFSGYEGDKATYEFANKTYDFLLETKGLTGKFAEVRMGKFSNSYGQYNIKRSSASITSSSNSNDNIHIGDNSLVYRFKVETIGEMELNKGTITLEPSDWTTINDLKNSLRNFQLKYCEGEKACDPSKANLVGNMSANEKDGKLVLSFTSGATLKGGRYTFEIYANVLEDLSGKNLVVSANGEDISFENRDNDKIKATGRFRSSALSVKKGSLTFINSNGQRLEVVNTRIDLGTFTISNTGGVDTYLRSAKAKFLLNGAPTTAISNVYIVEKIGNNAVDLSKNKLSTPTSVNSDGTVDLKLTQPVLIKKNTDRRFLVVGEVNGDVMDFTTGVPFRTVFPKGGIHTGTTAQATLSNDADVNSYYITLFANGKVEAYNVAPQTSDYQNNKKKTIVSPSDGTVLLGKLTVVAKRENVRVSEFVFKDKNASQGINNIDMIEVKAGNKSTDLVVGTATVDSSKGSAIVKLSDPRTNLSDADEKLTTVNKDRAEGKTYYIYGRMTNAESFNPATAEVFVEKIKVNGLQSGNKVPEGDINLAVDDIKAIKMYPAVPSVTYVNKEKTSTIGVNTNTRLAQFTFSNDQGKAVRVNKMMFGISGGNNLVLRNVTLKQGSEVLDRVDNLDLSKDNKVTFTPRHNGKPLVLVPWSSKDITVTANVLRKNTDSADVQFTYYFGDTENPTAEHSFEYCATTDLSGNTCVTANTLSPTSTLWFVNSTENENEISYKAVDISSGGSATLSCPTTDALITTNNVTPTFTNTGKVEVKLSVNNPEGIDLNTNPAKVELVGATGIQLNGLTQKLVGSELVLTFNRDSNYKNASEIAGSIKTTLEDKCGKVLAPVTTALTAPAVSIYGVSFEGNDPAFLKSGTNSLSVHFTGTPTTQVNKIKTVGNTIEFYHDDDKLFDLSGTALKLTGGDAEYTPVVANVTANVMKLTYAGATTTSQLAIEPTWELLSSNLFPEFTKLLKANLGDITAGTHAGFAH